MQTAIVFFKKSKKEKKIMKVRCIGRKPETSTSCTASWDILFLNRKCVIQVHSAIVFSQREECFGRVNGYVSYN